MKRLVLFDIDETMVHSDGVGKRAIESALTQVFEAPIDATGHSMSGKTDPQICHELLTAHGYSDIAIKNKLPQVFESYLKLLEQEILKAQTFHLHRGVVELINELESASWCHLGLLTGNIESGARLKLAPFKLNSFFAFGAFGCDSANRLDLPSIAHKRAQNVFAQDFAIKDLVIIGDAVNDILCAKGYGVKSIITSTGRTTEKELRNHNPDYLFTSLENTDKILEAVLA